MPRRDDNRRTPIPRPAVTGTFAPEAHGGAYIGHDNALPQLNKDRWARILNFDGNRFYGWEEVYPFGGDQFGVIDGTYKGSPIQNPLFEANGLAIPLGNNVRFRRAYFDPVLDWVMVAVTEPVGPLFVRMTKDAVQDDHPEFNTLALAPPNALIQEWDFIEDDWCDTDQTLTVSCIDSLPNDCNDFISNGRLPLREGDRFWVLFNIAAQKWLPTYEPRSAPVRVTSTTPNAIGLLPAVVYVFDDSNFIDLDGLPCLVRDLNSPAAPTLTPQVYNAADLIGHGFGMCIYGVGCCGAPFVPSSSSSSSSSNSSSQSQSNSQSNCGCVPDTCGLCPPNTLSLYWTIRSKVAGFDNPASLCFPFSGTFTLKYRGRCTWSTDSTVNQTTQGGLFGPTWTLMLVGEVWLLYAAGTLVDVTFYNGCNLGAFFNIAGWNYGPSHACSFLQRPVISPNCYCPPDHFSLSSTSGSVSSTSFNICQPPLCSQCAAAPCQFTINLSGFGNQNLTTSCGQCKVVTPTSFQVLAGKSTGCFAGLNGTWNVTQLTGCRYNAIGPNGLIAISLTGGELILIFEGALGTNPIAFYAATIPSQNCCGPLTAFLASATCTGQNPATDSAEPFLVILPVCTPSTPCDQFNVGDLVLTNIGDCLWFGTAGEVEATMTFDGKVYVLTLQVGPKIIVYRGGSVDCCVDNGLAMRLDISDCDNAPNVLDLFAVGDCDNCCPTGSSSSSSSSSTSTASSSQGTVIDLACCPGGEPIPTRLSVILTSSCADANSSFFINYDGTNWVGTTAWGSRVMTFTLTNNCNFRMSWSDNCDSPTGDISFDTNIMCDPFSRSRLNFGISGIAGCNCSSGDLFSVTVME